MAPLLPTKSFQNPGKVTGGPAPGMATARMPTGITAPSSLGSAPSLRPAPARTEQNGQRAVQMEAMKSTNPASAPSQVPGNSSPYGNRVAAFKGLFPGGGQSAAHASPPPFSGQWPDGRGRGQFPGRGQSPTHATPPAFTGLFPGNGGNGRDNRYTPAQLEARRPINPAAAQFHRQDRG
jgi:hypothetical protein